LITIGSFARPLVEVDSKDDSFIDDGKEKYKVNYKTENIDKICCQDKAEWEKHASAIKVVWGVRNRCAHAMQTIPEGVFDWLIEVLFKDGDVFRIVVLSQNNIKN